MAANTKPLDIAKLIHWADEKNIIFILAAGFEERCMTCLEIAGNIDANLIMVVLDYRDNNSNEPIRSKLFDGSSLTTNYCYILKDSEIDFLASKISKYDGNNSKIILDISGMSRRMIFSILYQLFYIDIDFCILYTEAEEYYPDKLFHDRLAELIEDDDDTLFQYQEMERKEIVYSYDCDVVIDRKFKGKPEPGRPDVLIGFLTFKRSRLQTILNAYEFSARRFIISEPVRSDLKWRKQLLETVNYDLIKTSPIPVVKIPTMPLHEVISKLNQIVQEEEMKKNNIYLAPMGSKIQTLGCFSLWRTNPNITVVFSQPKKYFPEYFSKGYRNTFSVSKKEIEDGI